MKQRAFGDTGLKVPIIGQGTWQMDRDRQRSIETLRRGFDAGMTHVDTAEMYGSGAVERLVGEAISGRRDELYLVSKVLPHNGSLAGTVAACEESLRRLGTDRLDLYLLHWRGMHPLQETFRAFETLREQGKILRWGVSNFDVDDLEEAAGIVGPRPIACNQVLYHLGERYIERSILPWCQANRVALVGYSPFGSGGFPPPGGGGVLEQIARRHGATPRQVALAYLTRAGEEGLFAIPKSSEIDHALDNAGAADLALSPEELRRIEEAFPRPEGRGTLPMI